MVQLTKSITKLFFILSFVLGASASDRTENVGPKISTFYSKYKGQFNQLKPKQKAEVYLAMVKFLAKLERKKIRYASETELKIQIEEFINHTIRSAHASDGDACVVSGYIGKEDGQYCSGLQGGDAEYKKRYYDCKQESKVPCNSAIFGNSQSCVSAQNYEGKWTKGCIEGMLEQALGKKQDSDKDLNDADKEKIASYIGDTKNGIQLEKLFSSVAEVCTAANAHEEDSFKKEDNSNCIRLHDWLMALVEKKNDKAKDLYNKYFANDKICINCSYDKAGRTKNEGVMSIIDSIIGKAQPKIEETPDEIKLFGKNMVLADKCEIEVEVVQDAKSKRDQCVEEANSAHYDEVDGVSKQQQINVAVVACEEAYKNAGSPSSDTKVKETRACAEGVRKYDLKDNEGNSTGVSCYGPKPSENKTSDLCTNLKNWACTSNERPVGRAAMEKFFGMIPSRFEVCNKSTDPKVTTRSFGDDKTDHAISCTRSVATQSVSQKKKKNQKLEDDYVCKFPVSKVPEEFAKKPEVIATTGSTGSTGSTGTTGSTGVVAPTGVTPCKEPCNTGGSGTSIAVVPVKKPSKPGTNEPKPNEENPTPCQGKDCNPTNQPAPGPTNPPTNPPCDPDASCGNTGLVLYDDLTLTDGNFNQRCNASNLTKSKEGILGLRDGLNPNDCLIEAKQRNGRYDEVRVYCKGCGDKDASGNPSNWQSVPGSYKQLGDTKSNKRFLANNGGESTFYTALFAPLEGGEVIYQKKCTDSQCSLYKLSVGYERGSGKKVLNTELVKTVNKTRLNPNPPLVCKNTGGKEKMKDQQDLCIFMPGSGHVNFGGLIRKKYE